MITPGNWQVFTEVFASHDECLEAEKVLIIAVNKDWVAERFAIQKIYNEGGGFAMMWWGCHSNNGE